MNLLEGKYVRITLFFISKQCWTAEILSHFHYSAIKNRNKEMLGVYCFCSKTGPLSLLFHIFFTLLEHKKWNSKYSTLIAERFEE